MSLNLSFLPKAPSAKNYVSNGYTMNKFPPTMPARSPALKPPPWVCLSVAAAKMTNISTV